MTGCVVVVGGGIAGVSTAAALRSGGFDGDLTLIDAGEFPYDRPPLSKEFLSGAKEIKDIALQPQGWYDDQSVRLVSRTTVTALHPGDGAVELSDGTSVRADRVVLATGGRAARPPIPGCDHPRVHVLRTAEDADRLRAAMVPGATVLVVGAGLIGAEVASTARTLGCEVTLADPVCPPLSAVLGEDVAAWLQGVHTEHGIRTVHSGVSSLDEEDADVVVLGGRVHGGLLGGVGSCAEDAPRAGGRGSGNRAVSGWGVPRFARTCLRTAGPAAGRPARPGRRPGPGWRPPACAGCW